MFLILLNYKKSLEVVDKFLPEHLKFLDEKYAKNIFIITGRRKPRTGGVILAHNTSKAELMYLIQQDPFYIHEIADYDIIEFDPRIYREEFKEYMK